MADILTLLERAESEGEFTRIMSNPLAQFGRPDKPFLGLQLMPERLVPENQYTEEKINYRTVMANDATSYSPVQIKGSAMVGSFDVKLRNSDIGGEFKSSEYDALLRILRRFQDSDIPMEAMVRILDWVDKTLNMPLVIRNEKMIWDAMVDCLIVRRGDNNYRDDVVIPNPAGHRVAAGGDWSDDGYDPFDDIYARHQFMADKGMRIRRNIASTSVVTKLLNNAKVKAAVGGFISVTGGGALVASSNRVTLADVNSFLAENEIPPIEKYDKTYQDQVGSHRFLKNDVFVSIAETDQSETIDMGDDEPLMIEETLGYTGIGTPSGYDSPGKRQLVEYKGGKAPHLEGSAWQESLPVNQNPEAVTCITDIQ